MARTAKLSRQTKETNVEVELCLDGGEIEIFTGVHFFDHMLQAFAVHSGFGIKIKATGDLDVDFHHTVEDVGIVLGQVFEDALGDKKGITRYAHVYIPMDEALLFAAVDICGRSYLVFDGHFPQEKVGRFDTCLIREFMRAFVMHAGITLHLRCEEGENAHHMIEGLFKALAHVLYDGSRVTRGKQLLSSKGSL